MWDESNVIITHLQFHSKSFARLVVILIYCYDKRNEGNWQTLYSIQEGSVKAIVLMFKCI